jgi:hypothetical protein
LLRIDYLQANKLICVLARVMEGRSTFVPMFRQYLVNDVAFILRLFASKQLYGCVFSNASLNVFCFAVARPSWKLVLYDVGGFFSSGL